MAKKTTNEKPKAQIKTSKPKSYTHIDDFIVTAKNYFGLNQGQIEGFRVYMTGKHYQFDEKDFIPYLEEYLNKKLV